MTRLAHPDPAAPLSLAVDASDSHVGGVLQQLTTNGPQPLAFFSAKLSPTEQKYSAFDWELLAAYLGVRHFRFLLEAREFHILTDHKPLTYALHQCLNPSQPGSSGTFLMWQSSRQIYATWPEKTMWWLTLFRGHLRCLWPLFLPLQAVACLSQAETCHRQLHITRPIPLYLQAVRIF